jgi:hypothetical protein
MNVRLVGTSLSLSLSLSLGVLAFGCSGGSSHSGFDTESNATDPAKDTQSAGFAPADAGAGNVCAINNTATDQDKDFDGDGFPLKNDCNECDPNTNNGAYDVPGNGLDEDCSGTPDDEPVDCDDSLPIAASDAFDGAKAIGLCKKADPNGVEWGVVSAKWVRPDGTSLNNLEGVGVLKQFGVNAAQAGKSMLVVSSGSARAPGDPGYESPSGNDKSYTSGTPAGYPKESPACPGVTTGTAHDGAALEVEIRVPSNAQSFSYQQNFFTYEYSTFVCSTYNDFFVTIMDPKPASLPDGNIAFDQDGNPISVNNSLLQVCQAGNHGGRNFTCPLGTSTLSGTGFDGSGAFDSPHAATGWLTTTAPVDTAKKSDKRIKLRFAIWDSGDGILDSTALLDDFKWSAEPANGTQTLPSGPK